MPLQNRLDHIGNAGFQTPLEAKSIVFLSILVWYLPALCLTFAAKCQYLMCLGCPVLGFYPWTLTTGHPGYSEPAIYAWEAGLTLAFVALAGTAIYRNSRRLATLFAALLSLSFLLLLLKLYLASEHGY
jgi:hypothetical protein